MIEEISIRNFRNIPELEFKPATFNIIRGKTGEGKSTVLDAIAFTVSTDEEFHTLLKGSYYEPSRQMELRELVYLNFFAHRDKQFEFFKVEVTHSKDLHTDRFEIWKTEDEMVRSVGLGSAKLNPFIFVFSSAEPKKIVPRSIPYSKVNLQFRALKSVVDKWPLHFVGDKSAHSVDFLAKCFKKLKPNILFCEVLRSFMKQFDQIERINLASNSPKDMLAIKLKDRQIGIPLYGCPEAIVRTLSIIMFMFTTKKKYFLIDDIEQGLTTEQLDWLILHICMVACERDIQIFVSTERDDVQARFKQHLEGRCEQPKLLDLSVVNKIIEPTGVSA